MKVPQGFIVELVAAEPDIVNPVAMCFDERGRIWITESLEYPRFEPGPGRDRVKVLEDTDGDGRFEKVTIFADGLNIPSGVAVGHGGVWVANAPDILFMQDTNGDGRADKVEVVVTGFGRKDTHELPNSLTWGPDGYLYGCNGIFNPSRVEQDGRVYEFDGAIFRIDPRTRRFEIFAYGLSNPWGIAFNENGDMFVSACVIDHLWHIVPGGYYIRQAGPYPSHTWPIESIVDHKHQKAAYCGIVWFDSDAWPQEYRGKLYMGNIHGNCINADGLERSGATYRGVGRPDLLSANDAWFMPVAQKVGPDGHLYILDWYDRYHCYQDARRDAAGIDRLKGRLYRMRYRGSGDEGPVPRSGPAIDLARESDDQLIARLSLPNVFIRETAQRLLAERLLEGDDQAMNVGPKLKVLALSEDAPRRARIHALWALVSGRDLSVDLYAGLLKHPDPVFRAWGVRAASNFGDLDSLMIEFALLDAAPEVRLQAAMHAHDPVQLARVLHNSNDMLTTRIAWRALQPLLLEHEERFIASLPQFRPNEATRQVMFRAMDVAAERFALSAQSMLVDGLMDAWPDAVDHFYAALAERAHPATPVDQRDRAFNMLRPDPDQIHKLKGYIGWTLLATLYGDSQASEALIRLLGDPQTKGMDRLRAVRALIKARHARAVELAVAELTSGTDVDHGRAVLAALGSVDDERLAPVLIDSVSKLQAALRPPVIDLLVQRTAGVVALMDAIEGAKLSRDIVNINQLRAIAAGSDTAVVQRAERIWGRVRKDRNPDRERVIEQTRRMLAKSPGDPSRGSEVFARVCAQCHVIHGQGQAIGPDLTGSGRGSFEQLLSNVLDPNLVVGEAYQLRTVTMADGRVLAGMIAEDNDQQIVLKILGGQSETLPRSQVAKVDTLVVSFMPEGLENQMTPQELADLFAFLMVDAGK